MDVKNCKIDMKVRTIAGRIGKITTIHDNGAVHLLVDGEGHTVRQWARELEPVSDPCQSCEMAVTITSQCKQIAELQKSRDDGWRARDVWRAKAGECYRNSAYWREELSKLQKETLTECQPLGEAAKIYIQISPEVLERILKERD